MTENKEKNREIKRSDLFKKFPGIISYHFGYIAENIDNWFIKKNILLPNEFWFLSLFFKSS